MTYTYRDVIYIVLDELKQFTTTIPFEEEHIAYLLTISRAVIIKQKYSNGKIEIPPEVIQKVPFKLIKTGDIITSNKSFDVINLNGSHLFYSVEIPQVPNVELTQTTVNRFKYLNINKWLSNIAYYTINEMGKLIFKVPSSITSLFTNSYTEIDAYYNTILEDPRKIFPYDENYLDRDFAINGDLLRVIIDLTLADLYKHIHLPEDTINNGKNDLTAQPQQR